MIFIGLWIIATAFGLVRMWPGNHDPLVSDDFESTFALGKQQVNATVITSNPGDCSSPAAGTIFDSSPRISPEDAVATDAECTWYIVRLDSGEDAGKRSLLISSGLAGEPDLVEGDAITLLVQEDTTGQRTYSFGDYQRTTALIIWGAAILIAILILAGLRGLRSLVGLAFTIGVVVLFTLPALLAGFSPTAIAIFSGALMLLPTVFLVHGWNWKAASSLGGTLAALAIAALLAYLAIEFANLRGLGDEENLQILRFLPEISVTGILLCGFIIGALGVLNDVTVAQASTVNELAELDPSASSWQLFISAMKVGRDHITSMVYTLVLTYTGASLPILLLLSVADRPLGQTLTSDVMATEFLRTGVGALALTLAVPLTTLFAAYTVPNRKIQQAAIQPAT
ncbi:MAG: YibE/F family protein [Corynebacterium sp.]|nr:YibE/F family protein [Corynebacterium sp.]